jgi:hypothetical protein
MPPQKNESPKRDLRDAQLENACRTLLLAQATLHRLKLEAEAMEAVTRKVLLHIRDGKPGDPEYPDKGEVPN